MHKRTKPKPRATPNYRQNHGRPGVVYILENPGLRDNLRKIGCSTRSGAQRASDLNFEATTGTPGLFRCVYEFRTLNCGLAEELVFKELSDARRGKYGQEYFEINIEIAVATIEQVCRLIDIKGNPPSPPQQQSPPPPPPPPKVDQPAPPPPPSTQSLHEHTVTTLTVFAQNTRPIKVMALQEQTIHPERFCGYCRTLVLPRTKMLFLKYCPHCNNSI